MKQVEKWLWEIRWNGRWTRTKILYTEEDIRREHPEAKRVDGSMVRVQVPETDAERAACYEVARRPSRNFRPE